MPRPPPSGTVQSMEDTDFLWEHTIWGDPVEPPFDPGQPPAPVRVLYQSTWWADSRGRCLELSSMSRAHRRNVLRYLAIRCRELHRLEAAWDTLGLGVSAGAYWAGLASGAPATHEVEPFGWLEGAAAGPRATRDHPRHGRTRDAAGLGGRGAQSFP